MEKSIPSVPAKYSCLVIASIPKINARGLNINDKIKSEYYFLLNILMICGKYEFIGYFLIFNKMFKLRKLV